MSTSHSFSVVEVDRDPELGCAADEVLARAFEAAGRPQDAALCRRKAEESRTM